MPTPRRPSRNWRRKGITTFCLSLDPKADDYVRDIFGHRWNVLDRIERLPEKLPMLYMALTK